MLLLAAIVPVQQQKQTSPVPGQLQSVLALRQWPLSLVLPWQLNGTAIHPAALSHWQVLPGFSVTIAVAISGTVSWSSCHVAVTVGNAAAWELALLLLGSWCCYCLGVGIAAAWELVLLLPSPLPSLITTSWLLLFTCSSILLLIFLVVADSVAIPVDILPFCYSSVPPSVPVIVCCHRRCCDLCCCSLLLMLL